MKVCRSIWELIKVFLKFILCHAMNSPLHGVAYFASFLALFSFFQRIWLHSTFDIALSIPLGLNSGGDFQIVAQAGLSFINGIATIDSLKSGHPPIEMLILGMFPKLFSAPYRYFALSLCLLLMVGIYAAAINSRGSSKVEAIFFSTILIGLLVGTYPVLFALERGNTDFMAFAAISLFLLSLSRNNLLIAALMIFIAIHIKVYPLVFIPIFWIYAGWKKLFLLVLALPLGLFVMGKNGLQGFLVSISTLIEEPYVWDGNHSLYSWYSSMGYPTDFGKNWYTLSRMFILASFGLACLLMKISNVMSEDQVIKKIREVSLVGMAVTSCCLIPPTSHDYRLVISILPWILMTYVVSTSKSWCTLAYYFTLTLFTAMLFTNRHFIYSKSSLLQLAFVNYCLGFFMINFFRNLERRYRRLDLL